MCNFNIPFKYEMCNPIYRLIDKFFVYNIYYLTKLEKYCCEKPKPKKISHELTSVKVINKQPVMINKGNQVINKQSILMSNKECQVNFQNSDVISDDWNFIENDVFS